MQAHDATDYDDVAQFCLALSYAFHQRRRAHLGIQDAKPEQSQPIWTAIIHPLPDIHTAVKRGDVAAIEVAEVGVDSVTGEELRAVQPVPRSRSCQQQAAVARYNDGHTPAVVVSTSS